MLLLTVEMGSENLLNSCCDLPTDHQIMSVRNLICQCENVRNFVPNCPKLLISMSENFCSKIKCPKIIRVVYQPRLKVLLI